MDREGDNEMTQDFAKDKPIYLQLVERICGEIIKGHLKVGEKMPSVREYAIESGVNVNTVQRVYKELETMGITETKRGQGTFITEEQVRIEQLREEMKETLAQQFLQAIESLGFTKQEMLSMLMRKGDA